MVVRKQEKNKRMEYSFEGFFIFKNNNNFKFSFIYVFIYIYIWVGEGLHILSEEKVGIEIAKEWVM